MPFVHVLIDLGENLLGLTARRPVGNNFLLLYHGGVQKVASKFVIEFDLARYNVLTLLATFAVELRQTINEYPSFIGRRGEKASPVWLSLKTLFGISFGCALSPLDHDVLPLGDRPFQSQIDNVE